VADVSLIIVNYNGRQFLDDLCASLARQTCQPDEVIIVDNASTDGSVDHLRAHYPWITTIALAENVGFAAGNNIGAARATGRYLALLNNDTVADEHWLAELLAVLECSPRAGVAVAKIYRAARYPRLDCAGAEFNNIGYCWGRGANQLDRGQFDVRGEVPAVTACALVLRRAVLGDEPLFDSQLFMYYEEFDLSLRVRGAGCGIVYVPTAIVHHKGSQAVRGATNRPLLFQQFLGNRNRLKLLLKYYPLPTLLRNLPLIGLSLAYWDFVFLREGGPRYCLRALGAQGAFAWQGLRERRWRRARSEGWLPWMTRQGLRDILALRSSFAGGGE
jgi:GT2 family glycosyltransferase